MPELSNSAQQWLTHLAERTQRGDYRSYCGYLPRHAVDLHRLGLVRVMVETPGDKKARIGAVYSVDITPAGVDAVKQNHEVRP